MRNIADDVHKILSSQEMRRYLDNIVGGNRPQITPRGWDFHHIESGYPDEDKREVFINACYRIPDEQVYRMSVSASRAMDDPYIDVSVFITEPEVLHFDGEDSINYNVHLELVLGKVLDQDMLSVAGKRMISYHH